MRAFLFWTITLLAIFAGTSALVASGNILAGSPSDLGFIHFGLKLPGRAFTLGAGLLAMAFTYRSAWISWKNSRKG